MFSSISIKKSWYGKEVGVETILFWLLITVVTKGEKLATLTTVLFWAEHFFNNSKILFIVLTVSVKKALNILIEIKIPTNGADIWGILGLPLLSNKVFCLKESKASTAPTTCPGSPGGGMAWIIKVAIEIVIFNV